MSICPQDAKALPERGGNELPLGALRERGFSMHERGDLSAAELAYREVLHRQPGDIEVRHALGMLAVQSGRYGDAVELMGPVVTHEDTAAAHTGLGNALLGLGRLEDAIRSYDRALALEPRLFVAHINRGHALDGQGRRLEALSSYQQAAALQPDLAAAHIASARVLLELSRWGEALLSIERAMLSGAESAEAHTIRGLALAGLKRGQLALESYDRAIALQPDYTPAHINRGITLRRMNRLDDALQSYGKAMQLQPDSYEALANYAAALTDLSRCNDAVMACNRAIALQPARAEAYVSRGVALLGLQRVDQAVESCSKAIALRPDYADAYFHRSLALLAAGDYPNGWRDFEWRWKNVSGFTAAARQCWQPLWLGEESISGKTILLCSEQGLGDTLQFCRYAKHVAQLGARVILEVPRELCGLLSGLEGVAEVVVQGDAPPAFDCYCPLMSLPLALRATVSTIPQDVPYLMSSVQKARYWREQLGAKSKPRVGLVWSGGFRPDQPQVWSVNHRRNIPLAKLAALKHPGMEFYSVQKGQPAESELAELACRHWDGPKLIDFTSSLEDFSDTAAFIEQLDLVISVDTSTVHLAGALGKPVWILNRYDSCWRWLHGRTDSPWYPTARLYRQARPGDWDSVVERVRTDLAQFAFLDATHVQ